MGQAASCPIASWLMQLWIGLCLFLVACAAYAQTTVGGVITADTLWQAANSPFLVTSDLVVQSGATLTIEPGTTLSFSTGIGLTVQSGALRAVGTPSSPIVFTASTDTPDGTPAPGQWGAVRLEDGTVDNKTILEHVQLRYGSGMVLQAASPTLQHVTIQHHAAPAIAMDLKSSPAGTGVVATGNTLNGIRIPAGEVNDSIAWKIAGIPYVVQGEVSIGAAPAITSINPSAIQAGRTTDVTIQGSRLSGAESIAFATPGIAATLNTGATDTAIPVKVTVPADQPLTTVPFAVQTAAGLVRMDAGLSIIATKPTIGIQSIVPSSLRRGESKAITITGTSLQGAQVTPASGAGLSLTNLHTTDTQASFTLAATSAATLGQQSLTLTNPSIANSNTAVITVNPMLPKVSTSPAQLSTPPDSKPRSFELLLTNSDTIEHTVNLAMYDPSIATVSPSTITIQPGTTKVTATFTGIKLGTTQLTLSSPTLTSVNVQTYVTNLMNGESIGPVTSPVITVTQQSGMIAGPIVSRPVVVMQTRNLEVGPVASHVIGVVQTQGTISGPFVSAPVGVNQLSTSSAGPIVSSPVGVKQE